MSEHSSQLKILLLTKTRGYRHDSIPSLIKAITNLPHTVHATEDSSDLLKLPEYDIVVLGQNTGNYLEQDEVEALSQFTHGGGGVVGIHAATSGMKECKEYREILGATFTEHPDPQWGRIKLEDSEHYITKSLPPPVVSGADQASFSSTWPPCFSWFDEWYNFRNPFPDGDNYHVLLTVDESTYSGGKHPEHHPLAWCRDVGKGRVFYTSLGHFDEAYEDEWFMGLVKRGIEWVARRESGSG